MESEQQPTKNLNAESLRGLSDIIEAILTDWKYPEVGTVEFKERQMDNEVPPEELREQINLIEFFGSTGFGRQGFFPQR